MNWLNKPYPKLEDPKIKLAVCLGIGIVCFLFLLTFQPYGLSKVKDNKSIFILGFGGIAFAALFIFYFIAEYIFPSLFITSNWKVKSHIILHGLIVLLISILNYLYNSIVGADYSPQHSLPKFIYITITVGFTPILLITYITEKIARQKNEELANEISGQLETSPLPSSEMGVIKTNDSDSKNLEIEIDSFLYAQAHNNYCQIYFINGDSIKNKLIRISLKKLEEQLKNPKEIIRCHKSFLVNKNHIEKVCGNARSLYIKIQNLEVDIPVSRSFDKSQLI